MMLLVQNLLRKFKVPSEVIRLKVMCIFLGKNLIFFEGNLMKMGGRLWQGVFDVN